MLYHPFLIKILDYSLTFLSLILTHLLIVSPMHLLLLVCQSLLNRCIVLLTSPLSFLNVILCCPIVRIARGLATLFSISASISARKRGVMDMIHQCTLHNIYHFSHVLPTTHHMLFLISPFLAILTLKLSTWLASIYIPTTTFSASVSISDRPFSRIIV